MCWDKHKTQTLVRLSRNVSNSNYTLCETHANMACETAQTSGNDATLNIIYKWILCEVVNASEG